MGNKMNLEFNLNSRWIIDLSVKGKKIVLVEVNNEK